jgi:uncharacterized protein YhbP (UPF0306 family)
MRKYNALEQDAFDFLKDNYAAVIATCLDGRPHATTVYYDIDEDFNFFYLTKRNTQKNIQTAFNPKVALVVGTGPERITVQVRGTASILEGEDKTEGLKRMTARYSDKGIEDLPTKTMQTLKGEHFVAFKIVPDELIFMNMDSKWYPNSVSTSYHKIV